MKRKVATVDNVNEGISRRLVLAERSDQRPGRLATWSSGLRSVEWSEVLWRHSVVQSLVSEHGDYELNALGTRSGIVSRRMKIRSCGFQHLVGQSL